MQVLHARIPWQCTSWNRQRTAGPSGPHLLTTGVVQRLVSAMSLTDLRSVYCDVCDRTFVGRTEYNNHCNRNKNHQRLVRYAQSRRGKENHKRPREEAENDPLPDIGRRRVLEEIPPPAQTASLPAHPPLHEKDAGVAHPAECDDNGPPVPDISTEFDYIDPLQTPPPSSRHTCPRVNFPKAPVDPSNDAQSQLDPLAAIAAPILMSLSKKQLDTLLYIMTHEKFNNKTMPWKKADALYAYLDESKACAHA